MNRFSRYRLVPSLLGLLLVLRCTSAIAEIELPQGAHICIVGNTLADRMQHDGYLEATLQHDFPTHQLVIRNLGFSGDELTLRLRSAGFGSPDEHLTAQQADVVFTFFGYNESFAGTAGLDAFRQSLREYLQHLQSTNFNGANPPQVVVVSPIAHEDLQSPDLPDGTVNNARLEAYVAAMREVADQLQVPFVDLFHATQALYQSSEPLTINGVHLNEAGNRHVARAIQHSLWPDKAEIDWSDARAAALRRAVQEKNFYWFNRYRTTDGYSIFGGRADLAFVDGQTNRVVMDREMEVLDALTAQRDQAIWAAAQGREYTPDDNATPDFIPVETNKRGDGPNGEHLFLSGEAAIEKMTVADHMQVQLFASEEQFPELINPVQMAFDTRGRLWVTAWESYPHWKPKEEMNDKLLILEDTDGDGRADQCKAFAT
ncbi:MAG: dehydrogenase, partial [Planctomycetales bacterium]|nr:dehydrogenase [Planctomycetales bacterium]